MPKYWEIVEHMSGSSSKPKEIVNTIRSQGGIVKFKDVYNTQGKIRENNLEVQSPIKV